MATVALYARKSLETSNAQTADVMTQIIELRAWAEKNGYQVTEEYIDDGERGWQTSRPALDRMLAEVRRGAKCPFAGIVIVEWDRLYRDMATGMRMIEEIESYGVFVISTRGGDRPAQTRDEKIGRLFGLVVAEVGNDIATAHKFGGQLRWAKEGFSVGGKPPYGYKRNIFFGARSERRVKYEVDEQEGPVVRLIYEKYAEGVSPLKIARLLNDRSIPSPAGCEKWKDRMLCRILFAPGRQLIYLGAYVYNRKRHHKKFRRYVWKPESEWVVCDNAHEPILTPELVERVNEIHLARGNARNLKCGKGG